MSARDRNLGIAMRERDRRIARGLEDPYDTSTQGGDTAGDAFWGSLREMKDAAARQGLGFRADLGSIGRFDEPTQGGGRLTNTDRAGIAGNVALSQMADENAARQLAVKGAVDQYQQGAINEAQRAYDTHVLDSLGQPAIERPMTTVATGAHGEDAYTMRPDPTAPVLTPRQKLLASVPGSMRAAVEAQLGPLELSERKQTEAERAAKVNEAIQGGMVLSPDAIDENAQLYLKTGTMPTLGMKDPGNRAKILNRAAELASGGGGDVAANKADYKADASSLVKLQQQRDAVGAFEDTALKNLDVFLDLAKKIPDTGSPALNKPLRAISEQGLGDADLAAYNAARRTVIPEFAKILSNPTLSGQLSDSARKEVEDVISGGATLAQTLAIANTLKRDAANRRTSYDDQLTKIRERISKGGAKPPAAAVPAATGGAAPPPSANPFRKK